MGIDKMIDALISREGGYSDHPADKGGPTMFGITEEVARANGYTGQMHRLPREEAVRIYKLKYYLRPGFAEVAKLSEKIAEELVDTGVNMGPRQAASMLQRSLNVLNRQATDYGDVKADGDCGPVTLQALKAYLSKRGKDGEAVLLKALDCLQGSRYIGIAEANPRQEAFVYGWLANRVGAL